MARRRTDALVTEMQGTPEALRRRWLIAGAATLIAGIAAARTTDLVAAGGTQGTALICGDSTNTATQETALTPTMNPFIGLLVDNSNQGNNPGGRGIRGIGGVGVDGLGSGVGVAGQGLSNGSTGVSGTVQQGVTSGIGVSGNADLYGVEGTASGLYSVGVTGTSTGSSGTGVSGTGRFGVAGGGTSVGVLGTANGNNATGVEGDGMGMGPGVFGSAGSGYGVYGTSTRNIGVFGQAPQFGVVGNATSSGGYGVYGLATVNGTSGFAGGTNNANAFAAVFGGRVVINDGGPGVPGGLIVNGSLGITGTKSAIVPDGSGGHRLLYCMEAPESWFEDFGEGMLTAGKAEVKLAADFASTVDTSTLHVFLTPHDEQHVLHLTGRTTTGFNVSASASSLAAGKRQADLTGTFTYRVVAKRKDVQAPRLAPVTLPEVKLATPPLTPMPETHAKP